MCFCKKRVEAMIETLSASLEKHNLTSIEFKGLKITRGGCGSHPMVGGFHHGQAHPSMPGAAATATNPAVDAQATSTPAAATVDLSKATKSPMVGVIYMSANPESDNFVKLGATVKAGDTLCLIEAMKTFNPVKAEKAGIVKQILVEDADSVEFDQPLFIIE